MIPWNYRGRVLRRRLRLSSACFALACLLEPRLPAPVHVAGLLTAWSWLA